MTDKNIPVEYAANWLCQMAAADGVVSAREKKLLTEFAGHFGFDADYMIRKTYAIAKQCETPEVETIDPRELAGRQFEELVASLCPNSKRTRILRWRGDKKSGDTYALETLYPDLHIRHKLDKQVVEYFVECKYRSSIPGGNLNLKGKLGRYRAFSAKEHFELFIAIGVGGTPSNPEQFYIVPSRSIKEGHIIRLKNLPECQCQLTPDDFHNYINNHFNTRVFHYERLHRTTS